MKRSYDSPQMKWIPIRSNRAVADVCWAFANNKKPIYYNTYGTGYAELYAIGKGCSTSVTFNITYYPENMSDADKAAAQADMDAVLRQYRDNPPNNVKNYKGSQFSSSVDPSWS